MPVTNVFAPIAPGPMVHAVAFSAGTAHTFSPPTRAVWVASAGSLVATMNGDAGLVTFGSVPAGEWMDISISEIDATSTVSGVALW